MRTIRSDCCLKVLFVCTGNTCRSPMAEAIFNDKWSEKGEALSAGIFAAEGQKASEHTLSVLKENGIHLDHQSSQVKPDQVTWATHILTMTAAHKEMLMDAYPEASDKIFTLKEYVNDSKTDLDVVDPFGGNLSVYKMTYNELDDLISRIFDV